MEPKHPSRFRKLFWKLAKWTLCIAFVTLVLVYGFVRNDYVSAADDLDNQIQRSKEHGFALSAEDMKPYPPVKPEDNAAPIYRKLAFCLEKLEPPRVPPFESDLERASELPGTGPLSIAREYVTSRQPAILLAKEAASFSQCDFGRNWSSPATLPYLEHITFRKAIRLLVAEAIVLGRGGDWDAAISNFEAAGKLEQHIEQDRIYITALVVASVDAMITQGLEVAATYAAASPRVLMRLQQILESLPKADNVLQYLKGEVFFGFNSCTGLAEAHSESSSSDSDEPVPGVLSGISHFQLFPLPFESSLCERAYSAQLLDFWNDVFDQIERGTQSHEEIEGALAVTTRSLLASKRPVDQIAAMTMPIFEDANEPFQNIKKRRACVYALIKVLLSKNANGKLPDSLAEVKGTWRHRMETIDLNYRRTESGFRVYSDSDASDSSSGYFGWESNSIARGWNPIISCYPSWERYPPSSRIVRSQANTQQLEKPVRN